MLWDVDECECECGCEWDGEETLVETVSLLFCVKPRLGEEWPWLFPNNFDSGDATSCVVVSTDTIEGKGSEARPELMEIEDCTQRRNGEL